MQRIWNRPALPVYSLVTLNTAGVPNMNICTYVTAISLDPKVMQVAVYHGTATRANIAEGTSVLLQVLTEPLAGVVPICGRLSGKTTDKITRLKKRFTIEHHDTLPYFADCAGYMILHVDRIITDVGDHDLLIGSVTKHKNVQDFPILTTHTLRSLGYIRS